MVRYLSVVVSIFLVLATGCAKNPVTGRQELHIVSTNQEIKMGEKNYLFGQQTGGGQYNLDKELTSYVQEVGHKLAKVSDRPDLPYDFVVLNDSIPNAWAMPGGKIAVNRGLLTNLNNEAELAAVLGHEITHAAARHGAKSMERAIILTTGLAAANVALATTTSSNSDALRNQAVMASAGVAVGLISTKYSRKAELEADAYGMNYMAKAGYDPKAAVSLQETFVKLSENKSKNWLSGLFASHPPSKERVQANLERSKSMPQGLTVNQERYQQKMALLKKRTTAYAAFDKGTKAYEKKEYDNALKLADEAIKIEPKEALFYSLRGDVYAKQNLNDKALEAYNQAIKHNDNYFYFYHQRGLMLKSMGRKSEAKKDLELSQKLLPTETAGQALKQIG
ncbi:MAG: M48 family metalloprotease [Candidatus Berkiellales bacterium]